MNDQRWQVVGRGPVKTVALESRAGNPDALYSVKRDLDAAMDDASEHYGMLLDCGIWRKWESDDDLPEPPEDIRGGGGVWVVEVWT